MHDQRTKRNGGAENEVKRKKSDGCFAYRGGCFAAWGTRPAWCENQLHEERDGDEMVRYG